MKKFPGISSEKEELYEEIYVRQIVLSALLPVQSHLFKRAIQASIPLAIATSAGEWTISAISEAWPSASVTMYRHP